MIAGSRNICRNSFCNMNRNVRIGYPSFEVHGIMLCQSYFKFFNSKG